MNMGLCEKPVKPATLKAFCVEAMVKAGMRQADADITAEVLVTTDTWSVYTHGSKQVRGLMKNYRDNRMDINARAEVIGEGASWGLMDDHRAMPMPTSVMAMNMAIEKAGKNGIACVAVRNSGHYGAAGYYANMAAEKDMIGLSFTNVDPGVAVPGSRVPVMGTNPVAYAVPAGKEYPVMLDIATSVVAASKVFAAKDLKKPIPEGWIIDKDGLPTTDPTGYPEAGALMPMAGHKGYGFALMVEIICGVLAGGDFGSAVTSWVKEIPEPVNQSHLFIAINIGKFIPIEQFKQRMDELIRFIKSAPRAKGVERIYLPGEMEWESRAKALKSGMMLPDHVMVRLQGLADDYGLSIKKMYS
jgi:ureidoglycolate dehydrogenase (NAD+)